MLELIKPHRKLSSAKPDEYRLSKMIWTPSDQVDARVTVTVASQHALLADLRERLKEQTGFAVATLNLDHVVKLRQNKRFRQAYDKQTHVTADGRPVVWLSRCSGQSVDLVTGSDLVKPLAQLCADMSVPVALFGSTDRVLNAAKATLQDCYPGLVVAATVAPPMGFDPDSAQADALLGDVARSGARVCLLALGAPKQEILAARALKSYPQMGFLSVGASLDFIAGTQVRAPRLMRALAMEWLWRLLRDPRRLAIRYGACLALLPHLLLRAMFTRRSGAQQNMTRHGGV